MKKALVFAFTFLFCAVLYAQETNIESLAAQAIKLKRTDPKQTIHLGLKALNQLDTSVNSPVHIQLHLAIAWAYLLQSDYTKAGHYCELAQNIAQALPEHQLQGDILHTQASIAHKRFQLTTALGLYQKAIQAYKQTPTNTKLAGSYNNMGMLYRSKGEFDLSLHYFLLALNILEQSDPDNLKGILLSNIASIYALMGEQQESLAALEQSLALSHQLQGELGKTISKVIRAEIYQSNGELNKAIPELEQALALYQKLKLTDEAAQTRLALAKAHQMNSDTENALTTALRALDAFLDIGQVDSQVETRLLLATLTQDDAEKLRQLTKALSLAEDYELTGYLADAEYEIANYYLDHQSLSQAKRLAQSALSTRDALNQTTGKKDSFYQLFHISKQQQSFEEALHYYTQYNQLKDIEASKSNSIQVALLREKIERAKQEQEISNLKQESELRRLALAEQSRMQRVWFFGLLLIFVIALLSYNRYKHIQLSRLLGVKVKKQTKNINLLSRIGRNFTSSLDLNEVIDNIYLQIAQLVEADTFALGLYQEEKQTLEFRMSMEDEKRLPDYTLGLHDTNHLAIACISKQQEMHIESYMDRFKFVDNIHPLKIGERMQSIVYLPLHLEKKLVGCLSIQKRQPGGFSDYQLDIIRTLSAYAAIAIANAQAHYQLKVLSHTDHLTGLANRRSFIEQANYQLAIARRNHVPISFVIADIDHFKQFNDSHGHEGGDHILKQAAKLFKQSIRSQDLVARWGGEEFVFMLPNTDQQGAQELIENIRMLLAAQRFPYNNRHLKVTATFGVTQTCGDEPLEKLLDKADEALYKGKHKGRNLVSCTQNLSIKH